MHVQNNVAPLFKDAAPTLAELGFEPIPARGKVPVGKGWQLREITPQGIAETAAEFPDATNIGARCGKLYAVDLDLHDEKHVAAIRRTVEEILGKTDLVRFGRKGCTLYYYAPEPFAKVTFQEKLEGGQRPKRLLELLGIGQQSIIYGVHPDTGQPYRWESSTPLDILHVEILPEVRSAKHQALISALLEKLKSLGYVGVYAGEVGGERNPNPTPTNFVSDKPDNVAAALKWAREQLAMVEGRGEGSDDAFYFGACKMHDLGIAEETATEILSEHWGNRCSLHSDNGGGPFAQDWIAAKVASAYRKGGCQNAFGCDSQAPEDISARMTIAYSDVIRSTAPTAADDPVADHLADLGTRFGGVLFVDPMKGAMRPPIEFRDRDQMLMKSARGTIGQLIGPPKNGKTATTACLMGQLLKSENARVLYLALEGEDAVDTQTIPLLSENLGIPLAELPGRFQRVELPGFRMDRPEEVDKLIKAANEAAKAQGHGGWTDLIIDTQNRASGDLEEQSNSDSRTFWNAANKLRDGIRHDGGKRGCNVTVLHHTGKDPAKGARGASDQAASVDQQILVELDKETGLLTARVELRKGGASGQEIYFRTIVKTIRLPSGQVTTAIDLLRIGRNEYNQAKRKDELKKPYSRATIGKILAEHQWRQGDNKMDEDAFFVRMGTTKALASILKQQFADEINGDTKSVEDHLNKLANKEKGPLQGFAHKKGRSWLWGTPVPERDDVLGLPRSEPEPTEARENPLEGLELG